MGGINRRNIYCKVPDFFLKACIKRGNINSAIVWFWVLGLFPIFGK